MDDAALRAELEAMVDEQRELMTRTGGGSLGRRPVEARREQREVFVRHADRLEQLLADGGWPTADRVGEGAARGAWLVAQHADTQLSVQRLALRLLREAVERGGAPAQQLAMLEDRVAVTEGRHQTYGTQVADVVDGHPVLWPVADPDRLDERRAAVGLEPLATHLARYLAA
ncbi:hypothetical protein SAMN05660657_00081 [Geodermatophilus amargosae]|uniref:Uncharacterized protein n=1 Tax=Geodermatophilus amargosae TaxID=1296565 RepID=A0A1I6X464_9ACTN|nr:DUF6624 domain-containing protein [Geodermatophilus amargosae]SFT33033.1 hypothetical protein SAMN05660657_00081 [Geodermatophilus amargosae]